MRVLVVGPGRAVPLLPRLAVSMAPPHLPLAGSMASPHTPPPLPCRLAVVGFLTAFVCDMVDTMIHGLVVAGLAHHHFHVGMHVPHA